MALSVDEHPCLSFQMTPEAPDQSDASSSSTVSSSDSDSGCALEYYLDVKPYSSSNGYMLPSSDTEELKFVRTLLHLLPPQDCDAFQQVT
ncbi:hypothetical protein GDO81_006259 [Engystomops pustulosus]|uniref:Uncharacterized protein n=1 Tax=Engystomops pustulosus TaxID=76066 RepID=A0AAV7CVI0_ENGPU|nr:hypothetical protein GDO81_006259 [Engystomops pustulosus]